MHTPPLEVRPAVFMGAPPYPWCPSFLAWFTCPLGWGIGRLPSSTIRALTYKPRASCHHRPCQVPSEELLGADENRVPKAEPARGP